MTKSEILSLIGNAFYATASGTDTYVATTVNPMPALIVGQPLYITFTNSNTIAATLNVNGIGSISINKFVSSALVAGDLVAGRTYLLIYNGTSFNITSGDIFPTVTTGENVLTINNTGVQKVYTLLDQFTGATSIATLDAADFSSGSASVAGSAGEKRFGSTYEYTCTGTGVWRRTPYNLIVNDYIIGTVSDAGLVKSSAQMNTLFPTVVSPQIAKGSAGVYQYFGVSGWFYFANTITP